MGGLIWLTCKLVSVIMSPITIAVINLFVNASKLHEKSNNVQRLKSCDPDLFQFILLLKDGASVSHAECVTPLDRPRHS